MKQKLIFALVILGLMVPAIAIAQGEKTVWYRKFVGNGSCMEKKFPENANPNGWSRGRCPESVLPTVAPAPVQPTPRPTSRPTNTPLPVPTNTPNPGPGPQPTSTPGSGPNPVSTPISTPVVTVPEQISFVDDGPTCNYCCPLDPSEIDLNRAKAELLRAITEQVKDGNMPVVHITVD